VFRDAPLTGAPQYDELFLMALRRIVILRRPRSGRLEGRTRVIQLIATVFLALAVPLLTQAQAQEQRCVRTENILWGDGKHDDTAALNAWLRGEDAVWGDTGKSVGTVIAGRTFRLSSAIYVIGGTGRSLQDFRLLFPERGEVVTGGTVHAGDDPDRPPVSAGVTIVGGDSGEGVPFDAPDPVPVRAEDKEACPIS
jgi:hypothetical protein